MRVAAALVLLLVTSCLGDDDDGDPANYVAITQIQEAYKDGECDYLTRCGLFPDKPTCLGAAFALPTFSIDENTIAAVGAGRVRYDGAKVKECLTTAAARSCDKFDRDGRVPLAACGEFITGTLPAGAPCTINGECTSLSCVGGGGGDSCEQGVCNGDTPPTQQPAPIGELCASSSTICVEGAYCDFGTTRCVALKTDGMGCTQDYECDYGLACLGTTGVRTCKAAPTEGLPCPDNVCRDEGQYCNTSVASPVCTRFALPPSSCAMARCSGFYRCDSNTSTCVSGPTLGMSCSSTNRCYDVGTYCDTSTFVCTALKTDGQPCTGDQECTSEFCDFDASTPVCGAPPTCF